MKKELYRSPVFSLEGYRAFTVKYSDGSKNTILEHREKMEIHLQRPLLNTEIVHHINGNKSDNRIENLTILTHSGHAKQHREIEWVEIFCLNCKKPFRKRASEERNRISKGRGGPYCSKECSGSAIRAKQIKEGNSNLINKVIPKDIILEKFEKGLSMRAISRELNIHHSTVSYYVKNFRKI